MRVSVSGGLSCVDFLPGGSTNFQGFTLNFPGKSRRNITQPPKHKIAAPESRSAEQRQLDNFGAPNSQAAG
jgi:hypothetical protein